jgi:hypothetical protein
MCTPETSGMTCAYFDEMGCPATLNCAGAEGGVTVWQVSTIPRPGSACTVAGQTCRYSVGRFNSFFYSEFSCAEDLTLHQEVCPPSLPGNGEPCERMGTGAFDDPILVCAYERCDAGQRIDASAQCAGCDAEGTGCQIFATEAVAGTCSG